MNRLATITTRGQVTIPAKIRKRTGLEKKRKVLISVDNDSVKITPVGKRDVMSLYQSIDPGTKSPDPEVAVQKAYEIYAQEVAQDG